MALVAYDCDSSSESEEDTSKPVVIINKIENSTTKPNIPVEASSIVEDSEIKNVKDEAAEGIFAVLPKTKSIKFQIEENQIEDFIPRPKVVKERQKVKISIPSLSQLEEDDDYEPESKRPKPPMKGSGLISILPPVKGAVMTNKSFVPNVVVNKTKNTSKQPTSSHNGLVPNVLRKKAEAKKVQHLKKLSDEKINVCDIESDDDLDIPETFDEEMWEKICGRPKKKKIIVEPEEKVKEVIDIAPEPIKPYDGLDNQAFQQLVGKNKRPIGNIKLIDINEEEILPDKDLWMTKSLTDPGMAPKHDIDDPVDPTRRKKHHITYLAQQAKANEQELQAAWSASKNNRMASRAKYGF